ncbi:uncharacterized protein [Drosophila bipectinata]|uniref:uncharacterized protein n=1 Tax=Drosophila bipectinata TaxID=42026 RepID=UPI0038B3A944
MLPYMGGTTPDQGLQGVQQRCHNDADRVHEDAEAMLLVSGARTHVPVLQEEPRMQREASLPSPRVTWTSQTAASRRWRKQERMPRPVDSNERSRPTLAAVIDAGREQDERRSTCDRQEVSCVESIGCHQLFRILPVTLNGENMQIDTYALLDEGSSVRLIDDELILNLKGESRQLNVQWFGGKSAKEHTKVVNLQISEAGKPKRHGPKNVYGVANLNLSMQSLSREDVRAVKANARLPEKPYNNATPRILI